MGLHRVLRPFLVEGRQLMHGEVVDASEWRSLTSLTDSRIVEPFEGEIVEAMGRMWDSESTALLARGLLERADDPEPEKAKGRKGQQKEPAS